jgi:hypothetical protein
MYIIVWAISFLCLSTPPFYPYSPCFQAEPVLPFSPILLKRRHKHNKEDKAFLLDEIRIAIQRDSLHCFHAQMYYTWIHSPLPDLFTTSRSPSHIDLCHFKVTVLAPLQWGHQTLSSFGFPTYPHSSLMCSPLSAWPKSKHIAALP